jgi:hypothetical protein
LRNATVAFAHEARFRRHLRRMSPKLERLGTGDANQRVLAILAVETFYRPALRRAIEYAGWFILSLLGSGAAARITVGIAQVRISHWRDLHLLDSERFSLRGLARVLDPEANYEVCQRYLSERGMLAEPNTSALTVAYTGGPRSDYAQMLDRALIAFAY